MHKYATLHADMVPDRQQQTYLKSLSVFEFATIMHWISMRSHVRFEVEFIVIRAVIIFIASHGEFHPLSEKYCTYVVSV